jgi:hypothetical protein
MSFLLKVSWDPTHNTFHEINFFDVNVYIPDVGRNVKTGPPTLSRTKLMLLY